MSDDVGSSAAVHQAYRALAELDASDRKQALLALAQQLEVDLVEPDKANRPAPRRSGPGGWSGFYESSSGA